MTYQLNLTAGFCLLTASLAAIAQDDPFNSALVDAELMPRATESMLLDVTPVAGGFVAVGERGHILRSADGKTWEQVPAVPTRSTLTAVHAVGDLVWAAGHDTVILHSSDGGRTWTRQHVSGDVFDPDQTNPLLEVHFVDEQRGFAMGAYATFMETYDGGQNWQLREFGAGADSEVADDAGDDEFADDGDEFADDGDFGDFQDVIDYHLNAMARLDDETLYVAAERGNGYVSVDGGTTWAATSLPYGGSMFGVVVTADQSLLTFGMRGHVFESSDQGQSWEELPTGTLNSLMGGTVMDDGTVVLVGASGEVLVRRTDGLFESQPHSDGADLAGILVAGSHWIVAGENGVSEYQRQSGEQQ